MESWNATIFAAINADAGSPYVLVVLARGVAESAPALATLILVLLWVRQGSEVRLRLLDAALTAGIALGVAQIIAAVWYHPRPFELGLGQQYLAHVPEASFPSDHATLLFGLALPLLPSRATRGWGLAFLALALVTAWARVYLGVHFPFDMLGGLGVAMMAWGVVVALRGPLRGRLYPLAFGVYDWGLRKLHLPEALFPRR